MVKVGDKLEYNGDYVINVEDVTIGEVFELVYIENPFANTYYWIENDRRKLILLNDEIESFNVIKN